MKNIILLGFTILCIGCNVNSVQEGSETTADQEEVVEKKRPLAFENGKFFEVDGKKMAPPEISARVLMKMKKTAEDYLGHAVT